MLQILRPITSPSIDNSNAGLVSSRLTPTGEQQQQHQPVGTTAATHSYGTHNTTVLTAATRLTSIPKLESLFIGDLHPKWEEVDVIDALQNANISNDMLQVECKHTTISCKAFKL